MTVFPTHYELKINPNFDTFKFDGYTIIHLKTNKAISNITLNAADMVIKSCILVKDNNQINVTYKLNLEAEELQITLEEPISGECKLTIEYIGEINEKLKGFYQTKYKVGDVFHIGAVTKFQTEDARRAFPCFDEPQMKATYDIELIVDKYLTIIANTPVLSEQALDNGKKSVKFQRTPKMSSYLVFFAVAEFESIEQQLGQTMVRVITHPDLSQYGKFALDFGVKSLEYCEKYYQIPYPLPKLDLIATPAFASGAMENWGAILFRENLLLKYPGFTPKMLEIVIRIVIAHEITHQWFGNLVSPSLWKYIWLNESFADFFGTKVVDKINPELQVWDYTVTIRNNMALTADAYLETVPIEIPEQKKTTFNAKSIPIIYAKGASVLQQVEIFMGDDDFQKGLILYLKKHAYDTASSDDLWTALEEASGKPITKLMKSWVLQIGYPLVTTKRQNNNKLKFIQRRFTYLENHDETIWDIPISMTLFYNNKPSEIKNYLLDSREGFFEIDEEITAFKINNDHAGFYRVQYAQEELAHLSLLIRDKLISALDRWDLENDMYALLQASKISLDSYLGFIENYKNEDGHSSITGISNHVFTLYNLVEGDIKQKIANAGVKYLEQVLNKIGYLPKENESHTYAIMRGRLLNNASKMGSITVTEFALKQFELLKNGEEISTNIIDAILSIAAKNTNDYDWFMNKFNNAVNEVEIVRYGSLFAEFRDESLIDKVLEGIIFTKIPPRNRGTLIARLCTNEVARPKMWHYYIANLDNFEKINPEIYDISLDAIITNSLDQKEVMEKFFEKYLKTNPLVKATIEKSFETVEIKIKTKSWITV